MDDGPFGDLDPVDPATVWKSEPAEFIPWLSSDKRLGRLGRTLGLSLVPVAREAPVGRFRADLVCRDRRGGGQVVIEAQLGLSDHSHFGQLLTYAAGIPARTLVWLATRFHAEHCAAVDDLNRLAEGKRRCFAVAMGLWKIGDSFTAPQFTVFAAPDDWSGVAAATPGHRQAAAGAELAPADSEDRPPFAENPIKVHRYRRGMTQRQLAATAEISSGYLAQIETGKRRGSPETLAAIERALEMPPGALARPEAGGERRTEA